MHRPRLVYWNNIPTPYLEERFNAIARRGNLDFEAWFSARSKATRSWPVDEGAWEFKHHYVPDLIGGFRGHQISLPTRLLHPPDLLVSLYAGPSFVAGAELARTLGARTAFWVVRTSGNWVRRRAWKELLKRRLLPRADAILTAGGDGSDYALKYGVDPERIFILPHAIDVHHFSSGRGGNGSSRDATRRSLRLAGTTFIYVGRLWRLKGLDYLVDAFAALRHRVAGELSLLLVGDGADEAHYRSLCRNRGLRNTVFTGFVPKQRLPELYAAADALVFPTLGDPWGLVIDEAMASSLPIVTTSAAGDVRDRVEDGVNGFIVPPADSAALLDRMRLLAQDPPLRERMGKISARKIAGHTPERWAKDFEDTVERILALPRGSRR
jgi:glycosyltransferase involved in cell wall biosynthesis